MDQEINRRNEHEDRPPKEEELPTPRISLKRRSSLAWLAPLFAILIAGFLVYRSLPDEGTAISILTDDGSGIDPHSTLIMYRGARVGIVKGLKLADDMEHVIIRASLYNDYKHVAKENTQFWIVRPEVSLSRIQGLETIISGPYITLQPGSGKPKHEFEALHSPPVERPADGLKIQLEARRLGSFKTGTPVLYRDLTIGEVYDCRLTGNSQHVQLFLHIKEPYKNLVRENSLFWNAGGFKLNLSLFGAEITTQSIKGILVGGIALATPDEAGAVVKEGATFQIRTEEEKADHEKNWLQWSPNIKIPIKQDTPKPKDGTSNKINKKTIELKDVIKSDGNK
jgi:paraquat-inducible protein B